MRKIHTGLPRVRANRCTVSPIQYVQYRSDHTVPSADYLWQLDMPKLKALALKELTSQLSKDNILAEVFTEFTAQ